MLRNFLKLPARSPATIRCSSLLQTVSPGSLSKSKLRRRWAVPCALAVRTMSNPNQVAVIGVTGYSGFELARILLRHPAVKNPVFYVRETNGANCLAELYPQLRGLGEAPLRTLSADTIAQSGAGTAFLATPHEASAEL